MAEAAQEYQVLARKWRPQQFAELSGQEHVVRTLTNAVGQGRVAHAYLFCGPRGVGKTTAARLLARALNCERGPTATPCGVCAACTEIAAGTSIDVAEIDGASNNGVDDVRTVRENARYLPARDRFKIYIIDEVHMLSAAAFNALLKTLEEPPPHVKFIFATTEAHKVPETIVSRCQLFTFRRIPLAQVMARLREVAAAEGFRLGDPALAAIARQAEGGMRDALSLLDQVVSACGDDPTAATVADALGAVDRRGVLAAVTALIRRDPGAVVASLGEQYDRGTEPRQFCEAICQELRALLVCRLSGRPPSELPDHEQREVAELAKEGEPAQLARLFELCHSAHADLGRAFDPRLALEVALLKGVFLAPGAAIADLLLRTEALARGHPPPASSGSSGVGGTAPRPPPQTAPEAPGPATAAAPAVAVASTRPAEAGAGATSPSPGSLDAGRIAGRAAGSSAAVGPPPAVSAQAFARAAGAICRTAPRLGLALKNGRLRPAAAGDLCLAYPAGDFRAAQLQAERAEAERLLGLELAAEFGPLRLRLCEGLTERDPPSLAEVEAQGEAARAERVKVGVLDSPAVRDALRILGGQVEEVRVLGDGKAG